MSRSGSAACQATRVHRRRWFLIVGTNHCSGKGRSLVFCDTSSGFLPSDKAILTPSPSHMQVGNSACTSGHPCRGGRLNGEEESGWYTAGMAGRRQRFRRYENRTKACGRVSESARISEGYRSSRENRITSTRVFLFQNPKSFSQAEWNALFATMVECGHEIRDHVNERWA